MKKIFKKYNYSEYFVNDTKLKKLYNLYVYNTIFDKSINYIMFFIMILTFIAVVIDLFLGLNKIMNLLSSFSLLILSIFIIELVRDYAKSKNGAEFFKKHWIDFILVVFLSLYFLFMTLLYFVQLLFLEYLKPVFQEMKEMRIIYKLFRR